MGGESLYKTAGAAAPRAAQSSVRAKLQNLTIR